LNERKKYLKIFDIYPLTEDNELKKYCYFLWFN